MEAGNIFIRSATFGGSATQSGIRSPGCPGVRQFAQPYPHDCRMKPASRRCTSPLMKLASYSLVIEMAATRSFVPTRPPASSPRCSVSEQVQEFGGSSRRHRDWWAAGKLYAESKEFAGAYIAVIDLPVDGPPSVDEVEATNIQPTTATLQAVINPHGYDTEYRFEYVDQHSFETEGGFNSPNTQVTASVGLGMVDQRNAVQAAISGLAPGTRYQIRAVAESSDGTTYGTGEFESPPPVSVRNFATQTVGPELVTLRAELNPNGQFSTYTIHLGRTTSYADGSSQGTLSIGNEFVAKEATFPNLLPNTTYHYQLVGENGYGEVATADQTFTTEPSAAEERVIEGCSNTNLREENNSTSLPDCRAYEQVSAKSKEGGEAFPLIYLAQSGERAIYVANGAFGGASANEIAVYYLAHRTESGWVSTAPISRLPNSDYQPGSGDSLNISPELDRWTYTQQHGVNFEHQDPNSVFMSMGFADGTFVPQATPTFTAVEGGPVSVPVRGQSEDLTTEFILTGTRLLESDPRPSDNWNGGSRIYEMTDVGGIEPDIEVDCRDPTGSYGRELRVVELRRRAGRDYGRPGCGNGVFGRRRRSYMPLRSK